MTPQEFLDEFGTLAESPQGVPKLRTLILQLAVRGRLTSKADTNGDGPYPIPSDWYWDTLVESVDILDSQRQPIKAADREARTTGKSQDELYPYYGATQQAGVIDDYIFDEELVLLGEDGVPFFDPERPKAYVISGKSWVNNHAHVLRGRSVANRFLCHVLNVADYAGRITGTTRLKLNQGRMKSIPVPVPPLAEQHRIVAKVDELMGLCDRLEAVQGERRGVRVRLNRASLDRLTSSSTARGGAVSAAWQRVCDHFEVLYDTPETLPDLRQTILQLAVQGKLVPQNPNDEPAKELCDRLVAERDELLKRKAFRRTKTPFEIEDDEIPFELPDSWRWMRMDHLSRGISDGVHKKPDYVDSGIPFVTVRNLTAGEGISFDSLNYVTREDHEEFIKRTNPERGDLLITKDGTIGVTRLIETDIEFSIFVSVALVKPLCLEMNQYMAMAFQAPDIQGQIVPKGAALKHLHLVDLRKLLLPVPPLSEQKRIVSKVAHLLSQVTRLESTLTRREATRTQLLTAAIHAMLEGSK